VDSRIRRSASALLIASCSAHGLGAPGGHRDLEVVVHLATALLGLGVQPGPLLIGLPEHRLGLGLGLLQHAAVLGLHVGAPLVQVGDELVIPFAQRVRVRLGLGADGGGVTLGAGLRLRGLVLGQPEHPLQALAEPLQRGRRQREAIDLATQVVDLGTGDLQLPREIRRLGGRGVPVGGE
jgi:hypothetical protein